MPPRAYTERFLYAEGADKVRTFEVPEGMRVVIRKITGRSNDPAGGTVYLAVHGIYIYSFRLPDTVTALNTDLMAVAYERETVQLTTYGPSTNVMVSGYFFEDPGGNPPWAPGAEAKPIEPDVPIPFPEPKVA